MDDLQQWTVPVNLVIYGESEGEAVKYAEKAIDSTWIVREDGIVSAEVVVEEVEEHY